MTDEESKDNASTKFLTESKNIYTRNSLDTTNSLRSLFCFFCDDEVEKGKGHKVMSMSLDRKIRLFASEMSDSKLLAKLSEGDMVSRDAIYHQGCLTKLL